MTTSASAGIRPIGSLATIKAGWNRLDRLLIASANPPARMPMARSLARTMTPRSIGSGPKMAVSRGSSDSASHVMTATSAITIMEIAMKVSRSPRASSAVRPGDWNGMKRNFIEIATLRNSPSVNSPPQTIAMAPCRSASGERRSFSRKRCRKCCVSSRSRTAAHHVRDVARGLLRIGLEDELREHVFQRLMRHQRAQLLHRVLGDNASAVQHDDARAQLLDHFEDVRTVEHRLAACGEG